MSRSTNTCYANLGAVSKCGTTVSQASLCGINITPDYSAPGYDTLVKGHHCNGYASILTAYGQGADCCYTQYTARLCNPVIQQQPVMKIEPSCHCAN